MTQAKRRQLRGLARTAVETRDYSALIAWVEQYAFNATDDAADWESELMKQILLNQATRQCMRCKQEVIE